jgi:hypothetical protein
MDFFWIFLGFVIASALWLLYISFFPDDAASLGERVSAWFARKFKWLPWIK